MTDKRKIVIGDPYLRLCGDDYTAAMVLWKIDSMLKEAGKEWLQASARNLESWLHGAVGKSAACEKLNELCDAGLLVRSIEGDGYYYQVNLEAAAIKAVENNTPGFVYVMLVLREGEEVHPDDVHLRKVGFTKMHPEYRRRELQRKDDQGHKYKLELWEPSRHALEVERRIHKALSEHRVEREYFECKSHLAHTELHKAVHSVWLDRRSK